MSAKISAAASRAALAKHFPKVAERLGRDSAVASSVVVKRGVPVDIRVEDQLIYGGDARRFALAQVEGYMKKPLRFFVRRLDMSGLTTDCGVRLIRAIEKGLRADRFGEFNAAPTDNPTFLIVLGLGLGHHLAPLLAQTKPRWLIIVEPLVEFFEHACHVVDWGKLVDDFKARGGAVRLVTEMEPQRMVASITACIGDAGVPYADGSWAYTHYPFWAFDEARNRLHEAMEFAFVNRGFFEDELVMMRNCVENFATRQYRLIEDRPHLQRPETAAVVGAGPSLDEGIETLKRLRERLVVFSAGTSLRALLHNGIVPDFHCELENTPTTYEALSATAEIGDLSRITLVASSTVDPRVPPLFKDVIFYFRDSVSSTQMLAGKHRPIYGTSPTCVNLAITMAAIMGFVDCILFGTDCGVRPGAKRHADGTVYTAVEAFKRMNGELAAGAMRLEGNFGGVVNTDIIYDACRNILVGAIRHFGLRVTNCSDGALIAGAVPCVPEALEVTTPVIDRAALRTAIDRMTQPYAPRQVLDEANFAAIREKTARMFRDLEALLVEFGKGAPDFAEVYDRVMKFVNEAGDSYGYAESIASGSFQALPRIAMFYGFRVADAKGRKLLFAAFLAEFRAIVADMVEKTDALFDKLDTITLSSAAAEAASAL